jgi:septum formation protein
MKHNLILASGSKARQAMLQNAGVSVQAVPSDFDEALLKRTLVQDGKGVPAIARALAEGKAITVSRQYTGYKVIGTDQLLYCDGALYSKAGSKQAAVEKLMALQGRVHHLISAVSVVLDGKEIWSHVDSAALYMKPLRHKDVHAYIDEAEDDIFSCVGAYALEGRGARLFEKVEGDFFTVLGMPLLPLLTYLEKAGDI